MGWRSMVPMLWRQTRQGLGIQRTEKGLRWICQMLLLIPTGRNCLYCIISSDSRPWCTYIQHNYRDLIKKASSRNSREKKPSRDSDTLKDSILFLDYHSRPIVQGESLGTIVIDMKLAPRGLSSA